MKYIAKVLLVIFWGINLGRGQESVWMHEITVTDGDFKIEELPAIRHYLKMLGLKFSDKLINIPGKVRYFPIVSSKNGEIVLISGIKGLNKIIQFNVVYNRRIKKIIFLKAHDCGFYSRERSVPNDECDPLLLLTSAGKLLYIDGPRFNLSITDFSVSDSNCIFKNTPVEIDPDEVASTNIEPFKVVKLKNRKSNKVELFLKRDENLYFPVGNGDYRVLNPKEQKEFVRNP